MNSPPGLKPGVSRIVENLPPLRSGLPFIPCLKRPGISSRLVKALNPAKCYNFEGICLGQTMAKRSTSLKDFPCNLTTCGHCKAMDTIERHYEA